MSHHLPHSEKPATATAPDRTRHHQSTSDGSRGTKDDGRQAVHSALHPDQPPPAPASGDGRVPVAWLHIRTPRGAVPTATSWCACGHDRSAVGHTKVLALIDDHTAHRDQCPLRNTEGRNAA